MIRINLLPPEFRKRQGGGLNGEVLGLVGGAVAALLMIGFWGWITFVRIPHAQEVLGDTKDELKTVRKKADEVRALEDKVAKAEGRLEKLRELVIGKMRWAHAINDFATLLASDQWSEPGYRVSCNNLSIQESKKASRGRGRGRKKGPEPVQFTVRWQMQLVGREYERAGDYVSSFFQDVKESDWWRHYGFVGEPVEPYTGDAPSDEENIDRVAVSHALVWVRDKDLQEENRTVAAEQRAQREAEAEGEEAAEATEPERDDI